MAASIGAKGIANGDVIESIQKANWNRNSIIIDQSERKAVEG